MKNFTYLFKKFANTPPVELGGASRRNCTTNFSWISLVLPLWQSRPDSLSLVSRQSVLAILLMLLTLFVGVGQVWGDTYEQLTSIANIDESAEYVLGVDGTGFHYEGTSSWGKTALPSSHTPIKYTLKKANDGKSFTASATISSTKYYLQVPTSNEFGMATSAGTNTDLIIGTTQVSGTNYAVANKTTTTRHLRINGASGLRSYAGTTGTMAFFYKVVSAVPRTVSWSVNGSAYTTGNPSTSVNSGSKVTTLPTAPGSALCDGSKVFVGWSASAINSTTNTRPSDLFLAAADAPTVSADVTYYAVFATETDGGSTTKWVKTNLSDIDEGTYALITTGGKAFTGTISSGHGTSTSSAFSFDANNEATSAPSGTCEIEIQAVNGGFIMYNSSYGFLYAAAASSGNLAWHNTENSYWRVLTGGANIVYNVYNSNTAAYLRVYNNTFRTYSSSTNDAILFAQKVTVSNKNYSNYATTCCNQLGSINGSISVGQTSAVVKLAEAYTDVDNADGYQLKVEGSSNYNTWTDVDKDNLTTEKGVTVNGLTCNTDYTAYLRAKGSGSYCEFGQESNKAFATSSYSIVLSDDGEVYNDQQNLIGMFDADKTSACSKGETKDVVTLTAEPENGYRFDGWTVHKDGDPTTVVTVTENTFEMPAYDVAVSAVFVENSTPSLSIVDNGANPITSVEFGNQEIDVQSDAQLIFLEGENLTADVTWALSGADAAYFAVTPASPIDKEDAALQELDIKFTPNAARDFEATLTFSSTGATAKTITLTGTGVELYTVTLNLGSGTGLSSTTGWAENAGVYTQKQASYGSSITLPSATPSIDCGTLGWAFAGWATAEATSGDKPTLISGSYAPTNNQILYAVYVHETGYKWISSTEELTANENYVLTYEKAEGTVHAMTNTLTQTYYTTSSEETLTGLYISSPSVNAIWKLTGNSSAWRLYNEAASVYIDLSDYDNAPIAENTTDDLLITLCDADAKQFNIGSKTTSINYLQRYQDDIWGVDNDHNGYFSAYIYKREAEYKTSPNCEIYELSSAVDPTGKGTVALSATSLTEGATATATYTVTNEDYRFSNWTISGEGATIDDATANPVTITMGTEDATITANFEAIPTYTVTWNNNGSETSSTFKENVKPTFPSTPSACDATSTTFYGWATADWAGKLENLNEKTVYTSAADIPAAPNTDVTYYSVFAKENTTKTAATVINFTGNTKSALVEIDGVTQNGLGSDYGSDHNPNNLKFDGTGDYIQFALDFAPTQLSFTYKMIGGGNTSTMTIQECATADGEYSNVEDLTISGNQNSIGTLTTSAEFSQKYIRMYFTKGSNVGVGTITIQGYTGSTTLTDYMTTCCKSWADPTVAYGSYSLEAGGAHALVTSITGAQHGEPTYTSSNTSVITVNALNGEVTPVGAGTAYVIVTWPETDGFCEKVVNSSAFTVSGNVAVTFNANGGSGDAMEAQQIPVSEATALNANTYVAPACKYFYGWATSKANADAETRAYTDAQEVTITAGMKLWAIWKTSNYAVTIGTGTGAATFTLSADNVDCGGEITVTATPDALHKGAPQVSITPSNAGVVDGTTISNITAAITVDVTFAEKESFEVIWSVNGVETKKSFVEGTTFADVMADAAKPAVANNAVSNCANKFMGWATAPITTEHATSSDVTWYNAETALSVATTFYAVWATSSGSENEFVLVEEEPSDWSGTYMLVNYSGNNRAMSSDAGTSGTFAGVSISPANKTITCTNNKLIWTFTKGTGENADKYSIKNKETNTYANIGSTSTSATLSAASYLNIAFDANNQAKISGTSGRWFSYNSSNTEFRTYSGNYNGVYLYKNGETSDYITSCCALQPATNIAVSSTTANSVTLTWTDPSPVTGITKLQVVDANDVLKVDNIILGTQTATISGLTECDAYTYRIISVGNECEVYSESVNAVPFGDAKTVTFQYNDGETADVVVETSCGALSVNLPATPSRDGYQFQGWFNGEAQVTSAITPTENMTIDAHWAQLYTVTYDLNGGSLSPAPEEVSYIAGAEVTLVSGAPSKVFSVFNEWTFSPSVTMIDETHFTMPAENVTITATYTGKEGTWMLVTDATTLAAEDTVVIAYNGSNKVAGEISSNVMASVAASFSTDKSVMNTVPNDAVIFKLSGNATDGWAFNKIPNGEKLGSTSANKMAWDNGTQTWSISIAADGKATINAGAKIGNLQYNSSSPRFTTYTSNQSLPQLYRFREGTFYAVNLPASVTGGTVYASPVMAKAGQMVTLTYTPSQGYTVKTLSISGASGDVEYSPSLAAGITEYTFTMPEEAVTVAAEFEMLPSVEYTLVEDVNNLAVGMEFLLVGSNAGNTKYYASGAVNGSGSGNYLAGQEISAPVEKQISITTQAIADITLDGEPAKWKLMIGETQLFVNDEWTIAINEGTVTIAEVGATNNIVQFNASGTRFKDYTSTQQPIAIYALPYTTAYTLTYDIEGADKAIKVVEGYEFTILNTNCGAAPANCEFVNKWTDGTNFYKVGDKITLSNDVTLTPCWKLTQTEDVDIDGLPEGVTEIVVKDGKDLNVNDAKTLDNLTVEAGGTVSGTANLTVNDFTIEASQVDSKSGQVTGTGALNVTGEAYFDLKVAEAGGVTAGWYTFAVPFEVDALNGVYYGDTKLTNEVNYAIMAYDGEVRATGKYGWKKYRGILQPGTMYTITLGNTDYNVLRFRKAEGSVVAENKVALHKYPLKGGNTGDNGWNAVANPNLYYSSCSMSVAEKVQYYDHESNTFSPDNAADITYIVGSCFFVQANNDGTMTMDYDATPGTLKAPQREAVATEEFKVRLGKTTEDYVDQLFVSASEDATDTYQTGHDLRKCTIDSKGAKVAQMTVNGYGMSLCDAEFPLVNNTAIFPLTLTSPKAEAYTLYIARQPENATLYLMQNGSIIWNLTTSPFVIDLPQGSETSYSLMLVNAAQTPTDVETVSGERLEVSGVQKIILNEHVYILRDGKMYDAAGAVVR